MYPLVISMQIYKSQGFPFSSISPFFFSKAPGIFPFFLEWPQVLLIQNLQTFFFCKNSWRTRVLFVWPLIPLFWTTGDISSGFQSQSGQPYWHLAEAYVLHIPWDSPLVWQLPTFWWPAWQSSHLLHVPARHWWDSKLSYHAATHSVRSGRHSTDWAIQARLLRVLVEQYKLVYLQDFRTVTGTGNAQKIGDNSQPSPCTG